MKRAFLTTLASSLLAGVVATQGGLPVQRPAKKKRAKILKVGSTVPAGVTLRDMDGKAHAFGDYRGKVVFVHFWSIICPWERHAEPVILGMQKRYAGKDVVLLAINANNREIGGPTAPEPVDGDGPKPYAKLRKHCEKVDFGHTVLIDHGNKVADLFGARTTPHCFVIDKKGVVRYAGALDDFADHRNAGETTPYVQEAIDAVLGGRKPELSSSRPYG